MADQAPKFFTPNNEDKTSASSGPAPSSRDAGTEPKNSGPKPNTTSVNGPGDGSKPGPSFMK
jgi:hypothetical protein